MATRYKVLGQAAPAAATNTDIYTVPALKEAIISTIVVCNRSGSVTTYRIAVRPAGAAIADEHFLAHDVVVGAADSTTLTLGVTLSASDVITVYSLTTDLSFSVFGSEIDL
jgi:hypothetical protein